MIRAWHVAVATFLSIALVVSLAIAGDVRVPGGLVVSNPPGVDFAGNVTPTTLSWPSGPVNFNIAGSTTLQLNTFTTTSIWTSNIIDFDTSGGGAVGIQFNMPNATTANILWGPSVTTPTIKEADLATASGTGATFTIQAQNETGTTSVGGPLALTSGTGTSANGPVALEVGGVPELIVGSQATGGGPAGITYANTNNFSITAAVNTTFTPTPAQYVNPLFTLTGTLTAAAIATIALPVTGGAFWKFDISQVTFTSGTIKWTCGGGAASAGISTLTTTSEIVDVLCNGSRVAINQ